MNQLNRFNNSTQWHIGAVFYEQVGLSSEIFNYRNKVKSYGIYIQVQSQIVLLINGSLYGHPRVSVSRNRVYVPLALEKALLLVTYFLKLQVKRKKSR